MKKFFLFIIISLAWCIILYPKEIIFNALKYYGRKNGIYINSNNYQIKTYILYNFIKLEQINVLNLLNIEDIEIINSIKNPIKITFYGKSQFGNFIGYINLYEKKGSIKIENQNINNPFLKKYFKKTKNGLSYDFSF